MTRWCATLLVCTGCLQPNPSFKPGSTSGGSETASEDDTQADIGTSPTLTTADDDDDEGSTSIVTLDPSSDGTPTTTATDPTSDGSSEGPSTTGVTPTEHLIFVSSLDLGGDFGALAVADELCTQAATDAGLGGTWVAIVSDATTDARDRIVVGGPIRNVLGDLIAEDEEDLFDGFIGAAIRYNETGREYLGTPYTGTNPDGTASAAHCDSWTATNGDGTVGDAGFGDNIWITYDTANCNQSFPFYCIDQ